MTDPRSIYYAHPMSWYGTDHEKADLQAIRGAFPEAHVINPAKLTAALVKWEHENPYVGVMAFFVDVVKNAEALVYRPFSDGKIGAGVAQEILAAHIWGLPIFMLHSGCAAHVCGAPKIMSATSGDLLYDTLTIADTRARIKGGEI